MRKPHSERTPREKLLAYHEAYRLYLTGWDGVQDPTIEQVATRLELPVMHLVTHATNQAWGAKRTAVRGTESLVIAQKRVALLAKIDEAVVNKALTLGIQLFEDFAQSAEKVRLMSDSDATRETSCGAPVKSSLEIKVGLQTKLASSFITLATGLKNLGMVKVGVSEHESRPILDPAKLAALHITVIQQNGKADPVAVDKPLSAVLDLGPNSVSATQ